MIRNTSPAREIIEQIVKKSGITKKLASEILHAIPAIIEEGLNKDGEVRVKGLGTFRLRWTRGKTGRNLKTGERVEIPSHNRVIFLPEQSFKEYINRDNRLLSYKIIPHADQIRQAEESEVIEQYQSQYQYQAVPEPGPEPEPEPEYSPGPIPEYTPGPEPEYTPGPEPEYTIKRKIESEPEIPARKRRIHWIVPVAISVIIILSAVFYFRTSRQTSVVSRQSLVVSPKQEVDGRESLGVSRKSSVVSQQPADSTKIEPAPTQHSTLNTKPAAAHLFQLSREVYGNPYLWVLIYKENLDKITDPDMVVSGNELVIPVLEGKPDKLTRNDSLAVSEGYRLVYEYYLEKGDPRAEDFRRAMKRYKP